MNGVGLISVFAQLFVCSLHIRGRARSEFDCLRAVRKFARNLAWQAPLVFLSSCRICQCSREKLPVGIFRAAACPSRVPFQSVVRAAAVGDTMSMSHAAARRKNPENVQNLRGNSTAALSATPIA